MAHPQHRRRFKAISKAIIEVAFIVFLFYANLLMGEFTRSSRPRKTLLFALHDIFTLTNLTIAVVSAVIGYFAFEHFRKII